MIRLDERHASGHASEKDPRRPPLEPYAAHILEQINSALLVVDLEGGIVAANPAAERILRGGAGSLVGRALWDWFPETPRDEVPIARTLRDGVRLRGLETLLTRPDGSRAPIGISCSPLLDGQGHRMGAVALFQDLTEVKQIERQVLQTEKLASIGQLAAGVAHEINNPMGFIHANLFQMDEYLRDLRRLWELAEELRGAAAAGSLEAIRAVRERFDAATRELDAKALFDDFAKAIQESQEGSERIRHIVQDLRSFSHEDREGRSWADVNQCLDSTANIAAATMRHVVTIRKDYGALPPVCCNAMQLKQVFLNLVVNAYQAILAREEPPEGGGEIVLRTEPAAGGIRIQVRDNGTGIDPEHAPRIFEPFFTTKEVGVGMGLGLSNSFNIVRAHGGTMRAESERGRGATFEVWLPVDGGGEE